jgi:hypothetical protein
VLICFLLETLVLFIYFVKLFCIRGRLFRCRLGTSVTVDVRFGGCGGLSASCCLVFVLWLVGEFILIDESVRDIWLM